MNISQINQLTTMITEFDSTKELYSYAKNKIIHCAKELNKEYLIIADTKRNKILFEKLGEKDFVDIQEFSFPKNEKNNITLMHGHVTKKGSPLSRADCYHLCCEKYDKIIAFNKKGRFSLLQRKSNSDTEKARKFFNVGILFQESPLLPKNPLIKWLIINFGNNQKLYENWIKSFFKNPNINFRYISTMFK